MFSTLYTLLYNNYYNRIIKSEETINGYSDYIVSSHLNVNFNPNDHINTTIILNIDDSLTYDYLIEVDENNEIRSRWFVIETRRVRGNQYELTLHRDVIADYYNIIIESPCFIEKAHLNSDNPLLFNSENMSFNQIKTNEYPLYDQTGCPWIVGYYSKNLDTSQTLKGTAYVNQNLDDQVYKVLEVPIEEWDLYDPNSLFVGYCEQPLISITATIESPFNGIRFYINTVTGEISHLYDSSFEKLSDLYTGLDLTNIKIRLKNQIENNGGLASLKALLPAYSTFHTTEQSIEFYSYRNKIIKDANNRYFKILIRPSEVADNVYAVAAGSLYDKMNNICLTVGSNSTFYAGPPGNSYFRYRIQGVAQRWDVVYNEITQFPCDYDITSDANRQQTLDQPYNIFAIPYGKVKIKGLDGNDIVQETNPDIALAVANAIQIDGQTIVQDIQMLPYFPLQELISGDKEITVKNQIQYSLIKSPLAGSPDLKYNTGIIFNIPYSRFTFNVPFSVNIGISAVDRKVNNECDKWRITSPNFSSYFDFSVEKNGGLQYFNVDCDYKPNIPYVHINPNFANLYGQDFNDPRGLVLSGDFSLDRINDAWENYQIQNKNFQNIFNRQIQNMEIQHKYQRIQDYAGAITGTVQGGASGAMMGSLIAPGVGTAVGAIAGSALSAGAGIADIYINEQLRNEAMDYTKDLFGYQLGNIQALPQTVAKVSALNQNNRLVPILEYYTATDIEKQALRDKIKYNGMTTMVIGKISNYLQTEPSYIKGQIIRLENIDNDYHVAKSIAKEINQGVYI